MVMRTFMAEGTSAQATAGPCSMSETYDVNKQTYKNKLPDLTFAMLSVRLV